MQSNNNEKETKVDVDSMATRIEDSKNWVLEESIDGVTPSSVSAVVNEEEPFAILRFSLEIYRFLRVSGASPKETFVDFDASLAGICTLPWVCMGDFNKILGDEEKLGGANKCWIAMAEFREMIEKCNHEDLGFVRPKFTWSNKRDGSVNIMERLYREEDLRSNLPQKREALKKACNVDKPAPGNLSIKWNLNEVLETEMINWSQPPGFRMGVTKACLKVLNERASIADKNRTIISLISNIQNPKSSKLISDNVFVVFECLHKLKRRKMKRSSMAIKLDMSIVYDKVEWDFLKGMMQNLGFSGKWIDLIMNCVTSMTYSFRTNGDVCCVIKPSRGLR
ncbi:hypothetical protein Ddye_005532 [Dipteronia dyeriana]|uniref:Reverse transcriptase n=1 Tax=Dipteronia dyeriana TaxID=168575 RepID=A0AAD9XGF3_9ROSI|nr:hypothetical protein Ddye_005532 [Dipteronia dyeriana]